MPITLPRRTLLRGLGGVTLALPFLEIMQPRRVAAAPGDTPRRYLYSFAGSSLGMDATTNMVAPKMEGLGYDMSRGLQPIADLGVQQHVSVVSGLKIPWGTVDTAPAGGRIIRFHATSLCPLVCGMRSDPETEAATGQTSDWTVSEAISGPGQSVMNFRVQPRFYRGGNESTSARGRISARVVDGKLQHEEPNFSPRSAWNSLFANFIPTDPAEAKKAEFLLRRRKSVVDLVRGDTERLVARLGGADQQRMQRHLDELRALELRLLAIDPPGEGACMQPADPGDDPPEGGAIDNGDTDGYANNGAWSNEELRAEVFTNLVYMAFTCDLQRVASLMFTWSQCFMNLNPVFDYPSDLHELGHFSVGGGEKGTAAVADGVSWHVKHFARLTKLLADTPDVDGATVLDNTAMVLAFEGGHGFDPESPDNLNSAHSTENMVVVIAGHAGGLNKSGGRHIIGTERHPVEVVNTAMHAVGVAGDLGEVSGDFPELFT